MSWKKEVKEISLRKKLALQQGGKEAIEIQHAKGRLTLRERIDLLLDKNSFDKINSKSLNFNFTDKDLKAFDILGLDVTRNWENIRSKFKKLVKKFHPDMNAGNKKFEEKLKIITLAYTQLKRALKK